VLNTSSRLSTQQPFGTVAVHELVRQARTHSGTGVQTWVSELIWREFSSARVPRRVRMSCPEVVDHTFRRAYDASPWEEGEAGSCA
jgi:deoxyribodipyrimidine photo-lyase